MKRILLSIAAMLFWANCFAQAEAETLKKQIKDAQKKIADAQSKLAELNPLQEPVTNPETVGGNKIYRYNAQVLSTNFTIPILRVNYLVNDPTGVDNRKASASFFNSIGAGIGISWGKLERTLDADNRLVKQEMTNIFGFQLGALFAANSGGANSTSTTTTNQTGGTTTTISSNGSSSIFALTAGLSVLNFQIGGGYELGTITPGQRRGFMTIAYSIPLSTLVKGAFIVTGKKPVPSSNLNDYQFEMR